MLAVPLKYLSDFWRTLEMPLVNCEINLILTWSQDCLISSATGKTKIKITGTKLAIGQGDDYTGGCSLEYNYFKEYHNIIAIDLRKQQALDADPKAVQQINFTGNLDQAAGATIFFIIEKEKQTILDFSQGTVKVLRMSSYDLATACSTILFCFNIISI